MNYIEIKKIFVTTANRICKRQYRYFELARTHVSEDEACYVMTRVLEEFKYRHGIERRTNEKHEANVGLVDLVIFGRNKRGVPAGWVEFKRGATSEPKIRKDFKKMMKEKDSHENSYFAPTCVSFFHIIPKKQGAKEKDRDVTSVILGRYEEAHKKALAEAIKTKDISPPKEFVFFLLDCRKDRYFFKRFKNIQEELQFGSLKWTKLGYEAGETKIP